MQSLTDLAFMVSKKKPTLSSCFFQTGTCQLSPLNMYIGVGGGWNGGIFMVN